MILKPGNVLRHKVIPGRLFRVVKCYEYGVVGLADLQTGQAYLYGGEWVNALFVLELGCALENSNDDELAAAAGG